MTTASSSTLKEILSHLFESTIFGVVGQIPSRIGVSLRRIIYPGVLAKLGKGVTIATGIQFYRAIKIEIHNDVLLERNSSLLAGGGTIVIGDRAFLRENVQLSCCEPGGQITLDYWARIDRGVDIRAHGGRIRVGSQSYLGPYCCLAGPGDIIIGSNCMIASQSSLYANNHKFSDLETPIADQGVTAEGIVIEDDCWLGTGVRVLDGVRIGRGSVIGAGAVVTKDIPPLSIAVGVPAKVIGQRDRNKEPIMLLNN
jgi:acetyltransferase-like isoleucine patch superfamily enzyme